MLLRVRVVSYNVLSSHLASPAQYPLLDPNHLLAANRLPAVLQKLEEALAATDAPTVFCLQEVSYDWAGAFHTWFANRGYHLVTGLYGKKFNGYMGVAMAYPTAVFETDQVRIDRLSDMRHSWPRPPLTDDARSPSILTRLVRHSQSLLRASTQAFLGFVTTSFAAITSGGTSTSIKEEVIDHWHMSENRHNVLLSATLRDRQTGQAFCIGNYHMPCAFYAPMVMTIHADLAAQHLQSCAQDLPYILAGDWNIKPESATYQMLTTGHLDASDPSFPSPKFAMTWSVSAQPMKSAYAEANDGHEPDFTNFACQRDDPENFFVDTLDYIFLSDQWKVTKVKPIQHRTEAKGPFPNLDEGEPSDHVLISADLELESKA